jgi:hypothetical protein
MIQDCLERELWAGTKARNDRATSQLVKSAGEQ